MRLPVRALCTISVSGPGVGVCILSPSLVWAADSSDAFSGDSFIASSTPVAVAFMLSVLVLKVTAFVLGYLIVRLGHDTLIKGVTGEVDFGFSGSGFSTKLKAGSPGALFVLMGAAIILWGLTVSKPMEIRDGPSTEPPPAVTTLESGEERRIVDIQD